MDNVQKVNSCILTKDFHEFPQSLHGNAKTVPLIRPQPLPSTYFLIRYSPSSNHLMQYSLSYYQHHYTNTQTNK
jgi:hypothetical protein